MTDQQDDLDPHAPPAHHQDPPKRDRRRLRAALRWGAAVLVLGLSGTATAFAVAAPDRTDLPGLRTPSDGRYTFPELTLPPLPPGRPGPFGTESDGRHWAELRGLLLPAPREAATRSDPSPTPDREADCAAFTALFTATGKAKRAMAEAACRRGAGRSWTATDGTRTEIRLVGFGSDAEAHELYTVLVPEKLTAVPDATSTATDLSLPHWVNANPVAGRKQVGGERRDVARAVLLEAGDLVGAVLMTNPKGVPDAAFRQVVSDQGALLG